jgi:hypothetical protein
MKHWSAYESALRDYFKVEIIGNGGIFASDTGLILRRPKVPPGRWNSFAELR